MKPQRLMTLIVVGAICLVALTWLGFNASRSGQAQDSPGVDYPKFPPTPTIGTAPTSPPAAAGAPVLRATFDDASALSSWSIVDVDLSDPQLGAAWAVKDGRLAQNGTKGLGDPDMHETMALTGDPKASDYTVTVKVYDESNAAFGLVARRQGNSYYRYRAIASQYEDTSKQVIEKVVDGKATTLASLGGPGYQQRQWHTASMTVVGSSIKVSLDGKQVLEATDSTLTSGQVGVYTMAIGGINFDDFSVTAP